MCRRRFPRSGSMKKTSRPVTMLLPMLIRTARPRLTAWRSQAHKRCTDPTPITSVMSFGDVVRQTACQPARSLRYTSTNKRRAPEVDGMAQERLLDTELRRERQRLHVALAVGRMCALDYHVR